jgi:hypothetical protein
MPSPARFVNTRWFATIVPAVIGYGAANLCARIAERYGISLFIGLPLLVSFLASFFYSLKSGRSPGSAYGTAVLSILLLGLFILFTALDGLICLLMALPLALTMALAGTALGYVAARAANGKIRTAAPLVLLFLFPCLVAFESATADKAPERAVTTSVSIAASASAVWDAVIAFPPITDPPEDIFRMGVAYPIEARIEGSGVGATRLCTFSTGSFVEPITTWQPGHLLAFDVTSSPPPMQEFSPYQHVDAPHLHGHMQSHRGQFRLIHHGAFIELVGTTWYSHEMWPQWYWGPLTDHIIHQIHHRVLHHIRTHAEAKPSQPNLKRPAPAAPTPPPPAPAPSPLPTASPQSTPSAPATIRPTPTQRAL